MNENINWKKITFVLGILVVISYGLMVVGKSNPFNPQPIDNGNYDSLEELMCNNIKGTPAWADYNGYIFDYGVKKFNEEYQSVDSNLVVDNLIKDKIYYLYNPDCIHCQRQAEWFGEEAYSKYKQSSYAVDCTQYW